MILRRKAIITIFILVLMVSIGTLPYSFGAPRAKYTIQFSNATKKDRIEISTLIRSYYRVTSSFIPFSIKSKSKYHCHFLFIKNKLKNNFSFTALKNGKVIIYLPSDFSKWKNNYNIQRKILTILLLTKSNILPKKKRLKAPRWLISALYRQSKERSSRYGLDLVNKYPSLYALTVSNTYPSVWNIIKTSFKPRDGVLFEFHSEACDFLLKSCKRVTLSNRKGDVIYQFLKKSSTRKSSNEEIFMSTFGELILENAGSSSLSDKAQIDNWFKKKLKTDIITFFMPATSEMAEILFKEAMHITYSHEENNDSTAITNTSCNLADLVNHWDRIKNQEELKPLKKQPTPQDKAITNDSYFYKKNDNIRSTYTKDEWMKKYRRASYAIGNGNKVEIKKELIIKLKQKFLILSNKLPALFRPSIAQIQKALNKLFKNDKKEFTKLLKNAQIMFYKAKERQKSIEEYLKKQENILISPGLNYSKHLKTLREYDKKHQAKWPAIEKYLDKIEQEYISE